MIHKSMCVCVFRIDLTEDLVNTKWTRTKCIVSLLTHTETNQENWTKSLIHPHLTQVIIIFFTNSFCLSKRRASYYSIWVSFRFYLSSAVCIAYICIFVVLMLLSTEGYLDSLFTKEWLNLVCYLFLSHCLFSCILANFSGKLMQLLSFWTFWLWM